MSDAWEEIQAIKSKRNSLRERLEKRKKERQDILSIDQGGKCIGTETKSGTSSPCTSIVTPRTSSPVVNNNIDDDNDQIIDNSKLDPEIERCLLKTLCELSLSLPLSSQEITGNITKLLGKPISSKIVCNLLQKFATQLLISVKETIKDGNQVLEVITTEHTKLLDVANDLNLEKTNLNETVKNVQMKRKLEKDDLEKTSNNKIWKKETNDKSDDILSLLSKPSIKEKENKKVGEEILDLLSKPTAKERSLAERFRSQGGAQVKEFCPHGTRAECEKFKNKEVCKKLHFKKIIQKHTDEQLGDCSFLNTCFHMDSCKYVHYQVDGSTKTEKEETSGTAIVPRSSIPDTTSSTILYPPQWVQCDLRYLDMTVFGKFAVIMADPPWDIHMELPYGTMSDDEMRQLGIPQLQDEGLIFLWVTGRAMELGRECLKLWGYERVDEIIWVKTNQLQRIIRTGRTGHWLNHGKEHCLVGMKGNPPNLNRGLDCDVIVAEVRATSHKPDEIYGMIERLSPGTRKLELFGRSHNIQPNWITLGNQVDGISLVDPEIIESFRKRYPDGNCMGPPPPTPVTTKS